MVQGNDLSEIYSKEKKKKIYLIKINKIKTTTPMVKKYRHDKKSEIT